MKSIQLEGVAQLLIAQSNHNWILLISVRDKIVNAKKVRSDNSQWQTLNLGLILDVGSNIRARISSYVRFIFSLWITFIPSGDLEGEENGANSNYTNATCSILSSVIAHWKWDQVFIFKWILLSKRWREMFYGRI